MMVHSADGDMMPPHDYLPATTYGYDEHEQPPLTLTDTDITRAFDQADPSPIMITASHLFGRITFMIKSFLVIGFVGAYPYFMVRGSHVDDSPVVFAEGQGWNADTAGVSVMLIARELKGVGLAGEKLGVHPQSRLTALPAWQDAKMSALSEYTYLTSSLLGNDEDLEAAARLLTPRDRHDTNARLSAAAEAFARYDGRVEKHLARVPSGQEALVAELRLLAGWSARSRAELVPLAAEVTGWPAGKPAIAGFYTAKARAHVAHELLLVAIKNDSGFLEQASLLDQAHIALATWQRAGSQKPLFVSNQAGDSLFLPNHLAAMAFYSEEAVAVTVGLADAIEAYEPAEIGMSADVAMLVTSP